MNTQQKADIRLHSWDDPNMPDYLAADLGVPGDVAQRFVKAVLECKGRGITVRII